MPKAKPKTATMYGIKTCDTIRKARAWLKQQGVELDFHDFKAEGIERSRLEDWVKEAGWETLLNRSGTTFRALPDASREGLTEKKAIALMLEQPSMIKRPVLLVENRLFVGFKPETYAGIFGG